VPFRGGAREKLGLAGIGGGPLPSEDWRDGGPRNVCSAVGEPVLEAEGMPPKGSEGPDDTGSAAAAAGANREGLGGWVGCALVWGFLWLVKGEGCLQTGALCELTYDWYLKPLEGLSPAHNETQIVGCVLNEQMGDGWGRYIGGKFYPRFCDFSPRLERPAE
jgi:hypothetical protein